MKRYKFIAAEVNGLFDINQGDVVYIKSDKKVNKIVHIIKDNSELRGMLTDVSEIQEDDKIDNILINKELSEHINAH